MYPGRSIFNLMFFFEQQISAVYANENISIIFTSTHIFIFLTKMITLTTTPSKGRRAKCVPSQRRAQGEVGRGGRGGNGVQNGRDVGGRGGAHG